MSNHARIVALFLITTLCLLPMTAQAGTRVTVTKTDAFDANQLKRVAIVTTECSDVVDCAVIEKKSFTEAQQMRLDLVIIPAALIKSFLLEQGHTAYNTELREALAEKFELDAIFEVQVPHAIAGDGAWGRKRSQVKIEVLLVRPSGEILVHAEGTSRSLNVVTTPETAAGNAVEKILERLFD